MDTRHAIQFAAAVLLAAPGCGPSLRERSLAEITSRLAAVESARLSTPSRHGSSTPIAHPATADPQRPAEGPGASLPPASGPFAARPASAGPHRAALAPLPDFTDTLRRDFRNLPDEVWSDIKRVYANPANLVILGAAYGGSLALQETGPDATVERHYERHHSFDKSWRIGFDVAGSPATHFAVAGLWYLAGQQTQNEKTYEVGRTLISALSVNGLSVLAGQAASWDEAPSGGWGTFPSGHTSSTFCFASVMHEAYGPLVGVPLYGLSALVAVERLDDRTHYLSDVVFGAVLGTLIGHTVAGGRDPEIFGWRIVPYADPYTGATGIGLHKSLP